MSRNSPLLFFMLFCGLTSALAQSTSFLDSLKLNLTKDLHDTVRIGTLNRISYEYDSDSTEVSLYSEKAIKLSKKINYTLGVCNAYTNLAWMTMQRGDYKLAASYYNQSLEEAEKAGLLKEQARAYNGLGMLYEYQGKSSEALDYHLKSLKILEDIQYTEGLASSYNNIANIYLNQEKSDEALKYYFKALEIDKQFLNIHYQNAKYGMGYSFNNIGNAYRTKKDYQKALEYYQKALDIKVELGNKRDLASTYNSMGITHFFLKDYNKTIEYNQIALDLYREVGVKTRLAMPLIELGNAYRETGQPEKSLSSIQKGLEIALEIGEAHVIAKGYEALSETYAAIEDYQNAHKNLQLFKSIEDSINTSQLNDRLIQLEAEYQFKLEKEALQKDIQNQKNIQLASTLGFLLALVLLLVGYRYYQSKKQSADQLLAKAYKLSLANAENFLQKEEISQQNQQLNELHQVKDRVFSIIAHDLKSPIVSLQTLLLMFKENSGLSPKQMEDYMDRVARNVAGISDLLNNLLYWAKFQMQGTVQLHPEPFQIEDYIHESVSTFQEVAEEKRIQTYIQVEEDLPKALVDLEVLRFLFRNLLYNAYKFSHPGGIVRVKAFQDKGQLIVQVEDQGIGMNTEKKRSLFKGLVQSQLGTSAEHGTGLGLMLSKEFILQSGGEIGVESTLGEGSTFWFSLPIALQEEKAI